MYNLRIYEIKHYWFKLNWIELNNSYQQKNCVNFLPGMSVPSTEQKQFGNVQLAYSHDGAALGSCSGSHQPSSLESVQSGCPSQNRLVGKLKFLISFWNLQHSRFSLIRISKLIVRYSVGSTEALFTQIADWLKQWAWAILKTASTYSCFFMWLLFLFQAISWCPIHFWTFIFNTIVERFLSKNK